MKRIDNNRQLTIRNISLTTLLATIYILWINDGFMGFLTSDIRGAVLHVVFALWFVLANNGTFSMARKEVKFVICVAYIVVLTFIVYIVRPTVYATNYFFNSLILFEIIILHFYYKNRIHALKPAIILIFVDDLMVALRTLYYINIDSKIAREIQVVTDEATGMLSTEKIGKQIYSYGIVDYSMAYAFVMIAILAYYCWSKTKKKRFLVICFFVVFCEYRFGFSIAFLFMSLSLIAMIIINMRHNKKVFFLLMFSIPVLLFAVIDAYNVITYISGIAPDVYSGKLIEMRDFLFSGGSSEDADLTARLFLYSRSVETFFNYPISGVALLGDSKMIGGHSTVFDWLAYFGFFSIPFFCFWAEFIKNEVKIHKGKEKICICIIFAYFVLFSFVDPSFFGKFFLYMIVVTPFMLSMAGNSTRYSVVYPEFMNHTNYHDGSVNEEWCKL